MTVTLEMVQSAPANINSFWPFTELRLFSGQVAGDGSGGYGNFDLSVLVSGEARHVYLLRVETSTTASNWTGDFAALYRSVNPQWNVSTGITTGISLAKMFALDNVQAGSSGPSGIADGQQNLPVYLGQVASAGTALLRLQVDNVNAVSLTASILLGTAKEFILAPKDIWPLYS